MAVCRTQEWVSVMSESEMVAMFVTLNGQDIERNISETKYNRVIPRLTKIIRSGITFVSRNIP